MLIYKCISPIKEALCRQKYRNYVKNRIQTSFSFIWCESSVLCSLKGTMLLMWRTSLWPPWGFMIFWPSWITNTAASRWRKTSWTSTTSARSRGTCRWLSATGYTIISFSNKQVATCKRLRSWVNTNLVFQSLFQDNPVSMAMIISRNLSEERKILAAAQVSEVRN